MSIHKIDPPFTVRYADQIFEVRDIEINSESFPDYPGSRSERIWYYLVEKFAQDQTQTKCWRRDYECEIIPDDPPSV